MIARFLRKHRTIIFFTVLVGIISVAPTVIAPLAFGTGYHGVQFQYLDDEDIYRARIHEVLDGHPAIASPYLREYKDNSVAPVASINEWFYAAPALIVGLPFVMVASKFLLPALLFLLAYAATRRLLGSGKKDAQLAALTVAFLVTLGYDFVDYAHVIAIMHGADPTLLIWTRLVNPIIGALEVFAAITLAVMVTEKQRYAFIPLGIVLALSVAYFFSYGMILAVMGSLFVMCIAQKNFSAARSLVYAGILGLALDAPYWYHALTSLSGEAGRALALRNGMFYTHVPVINKFLVATTAAIGACFAFAWKNKTMQKSVQSWMYIAALLAASWIAFNQQVLTGREIWYPHFVQYVIPLCYVSLVAAAYLAFAGTWPRAWRAAMFLLCAASLLYGANSINAVISKTTDFAHLQDDAQVFAILNRAPKDCVALVVPSDSSLERLIPAYTSCDVYGTTYTFSGIPQDRILHNYLLSLRLAGVRSEDARAYMLAHESAFRSYFFTDWTQLFGHGEDTWLTGETERIARAYQEFEKGNLKAQLLQYRMDYLVTDHPLTPAVRNLLPGLNLATVTPRFFLYSF
jgi:hypothetical protein